MTKKKSQVTIFLIIGVVIIILVGFSFYLTTYMSKEKTRQETKRAQKMKINLEQVEDYMNQCLDTTTKEALVLIGKQGGYIYKSQGGQIIDYREDDEGIFYVNYDGSRVSYAIQPLKRSTGIYSSTVPTYPWVTFPYTNLSKTEEKYLGIFGISKLPPINSSFGSNSLKSQIDHYIENNLENCLDWSVFEDQGYEISGTKMRADVTIAKNSFIVSLNYPIKIKEVVSGYETDMDDFLTSVDVRLYYIYNAVKTVIEKDIQDITFDISSDPGSGLSIEVEKDVFEQDDIIIIKDLNTKINARTFEFVFARKNRAPALHLITPSQVTLPALYTINDWDIVSGGLPGLMAKDPDEDNVGFSIEPRVPRELNLPEINFKVIASDGELQDYQTVIIVRQT